MPKRQLTRPQAMPFRGGATTVIEPALLEFGQYSMVQNLRPKRPGFVKRPGQIKQHSTADGTNRVLSLFQFRKQAVDEKHLFAQFSDGDVLEATTDPPGVTTGVFGSESYSGSSDQVPSAQAVVDDVLVYTDGVDAVQVYGGDSSYVKKAVVYKGTSAQPDIPTEGEDYSDEVGSTDTSQVVVLDSLGSDSDQCLCIMTPVPAESFYVDVKSVNGNSVTISSLQYGKNDNTWANVSGLSDGTESGGATLAQDGTISWTATTDHQPRLAYGAVGYWYRIHFSGALDSEVEINTITYNSSWTDYVNMWDGVTSTGMVTRLKQ